jgi:DNA-binding GntR family transcriptional regulator
MTVETSTFAEYVSTFTVEVEGTISDHVTDIIRDAILDGVFEPGSWLREMSLAEGLKVSRTPVRDALRTLAAEGFLTLRANQGAVVSALTTDDIIELYSVREVLEGLTARLAARRASPAAVAELDELMVRIRAAGEAGRTEELAEMNQEFHRIMRQMANNRYLARSLSQVANAVRRFRHTTYELPGRTAESIAEHEEVARAIREKDAEAAEQAAMIHISRLAKIRLQMLVDGY